MLRAINKKRKGKIIQSPNKRMIELYEIKMKTIVLNASPRKNWNTAQLLESAMAGAESTGAEVE